MSGRTKFTWKQRLEAVEMCLSGDYPYTTVAKKFNTRDSTLRNWIRSYKNNGIDGLQESHTWRRYTSELKLAAVKENYLYDYAGINNSIINNNNLQLKKVKGLVQLELNFPELEAINKKIAMRAPEGYSRFYVVTYEIDERSKMISKIALTLPKQDEMSLVEVADLTPLIEKSEYSISGEELEFIKEDKIPDSVYPDETHLFGYELASEDQDDVM